MKFRSALRLSFILLLCTLCLSAFSSVFAADLPDPVRSLEPEYATQFSVDYYADGSKLLSTSAGQKFLLIPENGSIPSGLPEGIVPLRQPVRNIYLAATATMCLFDALDRLDAIRLSGTKEDGWYIEGAKQAMREGKIIYAG